MPAAIRRVAGGRAHDHEARAFEIGDKPFGHQTGHQLGGVMRPPASVVTKRVHQDFGHVRSAGRDQVIAGVHQNIP
ncbi:hypothetical protein WH240_05365 [Gluconobacter wancherniae]|uniref:hypothetical protein n=1 Tax=Gluconobacter wancherniae TaxID=1307955 RepID=UPI001B8D9A3F|nr:hypothetical protein [Gluconobacter wancherniae]MBS1063926.1 hypothetical protein [Gluconobacter wancherniae]